MICAGMERSQLTVGIADCAVTDDPGALIVTYALGSCIAVVVYDAFARVGGMLHFMLPEFSADSVSGQTNPLMYADRGIPILMKRAEQMGAVKHRMIVRAAGGAQVLAGAERFGIGKLNHLGLRKTLWKLGYMLHAEDVGGNASRSLRLEVGSGRLMVKEAKQAEREIHSPTRLQAGVRI